MSGRIGTVLSDTGPLIVTGGWLACECGEHVVGDDWSCSVYELEGTVVIEHDRGSCWLARDGRIVHACGDPTLVVVARSVEAVRVRNGAQAGLRLIQRINEAREL